MIGLLVGTEPGAVATGSNTQPAMMPVNGKRTTLGETRTRYSTHGIGWLDPVATAPGSVPNPFFSLAQINNSLDGSGIGVLVIDNQTVTWLSPAASTLTLGRI